MPVFLHPRHRGARDGCRGSAGPAVSGSGPEGRWKCVAGRADGDEDGGVHGATPWSCVMRPQGQPGRVFASQGFGRRSRWPSRGIPPRVPPAALSGCIELGSVLQGRRFFTPYRWPSRVEKCGPPIPRSYGAAGSAQELAGVTSPRRWCIRPAGWCRGSGSAPTGHQSVASAPAPGRSSAAPAPSPVAGEAAMWFAGFPERRGSACRSGLIGADGGDRRLSSGSIAIQPAPRP